MPDAHCVMDGSEHRLTPLQQHSAPLRNKIVAAIRGAIETGAWQPGRRLVEKDLCEQLSVSRTSLREALRELQAEGIVEYSSNRGLSVSEVSPDDARNVYRMRAVLEAMVVEQFIERASDAQVQALVQEGRHLIRAYRAGVLPDLLQAKRAFYERICTSAGNAIALEIIERLVLRTSHLRARSLVRKERQVQSIKEIETLIDAIARRDVRAACQAAQAHVNHAAQSALDHGMPVLAAV